MLQRLENIKSETETSYGKVEEDYTLPGEPMTEQEYTARILKAKKEVEKGNFISQEDFKKEIKNW